MNCKQKNRKQENGVVGGENNLVCLDLLETRGLFYKG